MVARGGVEPPTFRFSGRGSGVPGRPSLAFRLAGRDRSDTREPANGVELRPELRPRRARGLGPPRRSTTTSIAGVDHPACSYLPILIKAAPCGRRATLCPMQPQALARSRPILGRRPHRAELRPRHPGVSHRDVGDVALGYAHAVKGDTKRRQNARSARREPGQLPEY